MVAALRIEAGRNPYTVEPNSQSEEALALLGSWTAAHHPPLTYETQGER